MLGTHGQQQQQQPIGTTQRGSHLALAHLQQAWQQSQQQQQEPGQGFGGGGGGEAGAIGEPVSGLGHQAWQQHSQQQQQQLSNGCAGAAANASGQGLHAQQEQLNGVGPNSSSQFLPMYPSDDMELFPAVPGSGPMHMEPHHPQQFHHGNTWHSQHQSQPQQQQQQLVQPQPQWQQQQQPQHPSQPQRPQRPQWQQYSQEQGGFDAALQGFGGHPQPTLEQLH